LYVTNRLAQAASSTIFPAPHAPSKSGAANADQGQKVLGGLGIALLDRRQDPCHFNAEIRGPKNN
jgi:hypothetical protein